MSALRCVLGVSIVLAIGCGGASTSDVNGEGGSGSANSDGGAGDQTGDSSLSGNPPPGGDDSGFPSVGADGGLISPPPDDDAAVAADGAPGRGVTPPVRAGDGGANQIECMGKVCDSTTDVCCAVRNTESCMTAAACKGDKLACSGTNSCATGVCCEEATGGRDVASKCEATCPKGAIQLCSADSDCTGMGETCDRAGTCEMERPVRDAGIPVRPPTPPFRDAGLRLGDGG
jgi:hypothetical protein